MSQDSSNSGLQQRERALSPSFILPPQALGTRLKPSAICRSLRL